METVKWLTIAALLVSVALCGLVIWNQRTVDQARKRTIAENERTRESNGRLAHKIGDYLLDNETMRTDNAITREAIAEYLRRKEA